MSFWRKKSPVNPLAPNVRGFYDHEHGNWKIVRGPGLETDLKKRIFSTMDSPSGENLRDKKKFLDLLIVHREILQYLEANPSTSYLYQERFVALAILANKLYPLILSDGLTKTETERLFVNLRARAVELTEEFNSLYEDLLYQAENDPAGNRYGELMRELEELDSTGVLEGKAYRELNTVYKNYVLY